MHAAFLNMYRLCSPVKNYFLFPNKESFMFGRSAIGKVVKQNDSTDAYQPGQQSNSTTNSILSGISRDHRYRLTDFQLIRTLGSCWAIIFNYCSDSSRNWNIRSSIFMHSKAATAADILCNENVGQIGYH
jgi:hypothetical protein